VRRRLLLALALACALLASATAAATAATAPIGAGMDQGARFPERRLLITLPAGVQPYQVTVTELTGWEHSLKNELILARKVHREHRDARVELEKLLETTGVRPKLIRELSG